MSWMIVGLIEGIVEGVRWMENAAWHLHSKSSVNTRLKMKGEGSAESLESSALLM